MSKVTMIEGIGDAEELKLKEVGVTTVEGLLDSCATKKGRKDLADKLKMAEKDILEWANRADLSRIKGIGVEYSDLLESAGVDTVPELGKRKPENLLAAMVKLNEEQKLVKKVPTLAQVEDWVKQAAALPRKLEY